MKCYTDLFVADQICIKSILCMENSMWSGSRYGPNMIDNPFPGSMEIIWCILYMIVLIWWNNCENINFIDIMAT